MSCHAGETVRTHTPLTSICAKISAPKHQLYINHMIIMILIGCQHNMEDESGERDDNASDSSYDEVTIEG